MALATRPADRCRGMEKARETGRAYRGRWPPPFESAAEPPTAQKTKKPTGAVHVGIAPGSKFYRRIRGSRQRMDEGALFGWSPRARGDVGFQSDRGLRLLKGAPNRTSRESTGRGVQGRRDWGRRRWCEGALRRWAKGTVVVHGHGRGRQVRSLVEVVDRSVVGSD